MRVDVPRWKAHKGWVKLSSTGTSFSYTLNNSTFKRKKKSSSTDSKKTDSPDDNLDEMDDGTGGQNNQKKTTIWSLTATDMPIGVFLGA